ncbi:MAG TPA: hypothetical protein VJT31_18725 [Rugosimonospora sp.]|nr:hypothetical protein [Rugosimonospora sp.]
MVQVDVFWSYGLGASFALAAAHQLKQRAERAASVLGDPYLAGATLYCATIFAPSGIWLLWAYPNWETMQVGSHTMPAWLVALFAITNTTQGILGYLVTRRLIITGRIRWAALQVAAGYFGMFFILVHGWDGTGYRRFFSTDKTDYRNWAARSTLSHAQHWATSGVALTLLAMGVVLIPAMFALMNRYHRAGLRAAHLRGPHPLTALTLTLGTICVGVLGLAIASSLFIHLFTSLTGNEVLGWGLGATSSALLLWLVVIRPGAAASAVVRLLKLPADEAPTPSPTHTPVAA